MIIRACEWRLSQPDAVRRARAPSAVKGTRIVVQGQMVDRTFTATKGDREGQTIHRWEVIADEVAISLAYGIATPQKAVRQAPEAAGIS